MHPHLTNRRLFTITLAGIAAIAFLALVILSPLALRTLARSFDLNWSNLSNVGQTYSAVSALLTALALGGVAISLLYQAKDVSRKMSAPRGLKLYGPCTSTFFAWNSSTRTICGLPGRPGVWQFPLTMGTFADTSMFIYGYRSGKVSSCSAKCRQKWPGRPPENFLTERLDVNTGRRHGSGFCHPAEGGAWNSHASWMTSTEMLLRGRQ